jgi:hypothetical protein
MQRDGEGRKPELLVKSQLFEAKEILVNFVSEVSTHKLFAPIVERI